MLLRNSDSLLWRAQDILQRKETGIKAQASSDPAGGMISAHNVAEVIHTTKPKFKTTFERDGILRVTKVDNEHLTSDQATSGYNDLGEFDYTYDSASNPLSALQANGMGELDVDRSFDYDALNRLITAEKDTISNADEVRILRVSKEDNRHLTSRASLDTKAGDAETDHTAVLKTL